MDISTNIHMILRAPLAQRIYEISNLVDQVPFKDLQTCYPIIVNSIFGNGGASEDWGLRNITTQITGHDLLYNFLKPNGSLFRICYKLLGDPQLKYVFPTRLIPIDLYQMLESGHVPQFYLDIINLDPHTRQIISLNLNPFDYYIFHFAVYLHSIPSNRGPWDSWNTLYYKLCCDYLLHFLPSDPTCAVTPHIAYFTGKTPPVTPMQTSTRHNHFPSLLLTQESTSPSVASTTSQLHPRGEIWRSETVLQVFIDCWLISSTNQPTPEQINHQQLSQPARCTYPAHEHVRIARVLIKQCHAFSLGGHCDPSALGELRRAVPTILQSRAVSHIRHLMHSWPLDASFRLVLELWLSYIQPWRYGGLDDKNGQPERIDTTQEDANRNLIDGSFLPFISENLQAYTEIFQLVIPRFLRLDLTVPKNAIMLFRFAKVFSQSNLIQLLTDVEKLTTENGMDPHFANNKFSGNRLSQSFQLNRSSSSPGFMDRLSGNLDCSSSQKYNQYKNMMNSMMESNASQYEFLLLNGAGRCIVKELLQYSQHAITQVEQIIKTRKEQLEHQRKGFFGTINYWLMGDYESNDEIPLEELCKVPGYLNFAITQLSKTFSLELDQETSTRNTEQISDSSISNLDNSYAPRRRPRNIFMSPKDAQERAKKIKYMGNPDLQPVKTSENGFIVHVLNQISSKINEMYGEEMCRFYYKTDLIGVISREVLEAPCEVKSFRKSGQDYGSIETKQLPPRICLRPLASYTILFWIFVLFSICYVSNYSFAYLSSFCVLLWCIFIFFKASIKYLSGERSPPLFTSRNNNLHEQMNMSDYSEYLYEREQSG